MTYHLSYIYKSYLTIFVFYPTDLPAFALHSNDKLNNNNESNSVGKSVVNKYGWE